MATSNVQLRVDATQAVQALRQVNRASGQADTATQKLSASTHGTTAALNRQARAAQGATNAIRSLASGLASIGATALVAGMVRGAASAEQLQLRLKMLSKEYGETARLQQFVAQSAATFGQSQVEAAQGVADVYARLRPLGISLTQIETVYKGFNAVALASGTTSQAASDAFLQLSQALGSGTLQGDEFRSVAEQVPGILRLVANEMGVTVGQLKKLGSEGKITSDILINALAVGFEENGSKIKELLDQSPAQRFKEFQNATQALSNALGSELLPALTPIVSAATELLKQFGSLPGPIKTITAAVVGLTAAFIALAPAISAVKGLMAGLTLSGLLAAGPWVALAAGITAATVALAGYRSEAQKIGAAARGGGAAELATARTRLSNVGQDISLLERQQRDATGRERGSIDRRLAALRAEQRQLRADVQAGAAVGGAAPSSTAAVTAAAGGGKAGGGRARASDAERAAKAAADELARVNGIVRERKAETEVLMLREGMADRISAAEAAGDRALQIRLQGEQRALDIQYKYAQELARENDTRAQRAIIDQGIAELYINQNQTQRELAEFQRQADQDRLNALQKAIELQYEQNTAIQQQKQLADSVATTIGQGMTSAFDALINGAQSWEKSLQQIASGVLVDIANQLIRIYVIEQAINAIKAFLSPAGPAKAIPGAPAPPPAAPLPPLPARAMGGSVTGGKPYLVGEKGPELFMPGRSGGIAPTGSFGGGINVVVNVDASGTSVAGNEPDAAQLGRAVSVAVQAEIIKQQRPGGLLAATRR
jgi:tape measure domain-containing protein